MSIYKLKLGFSGLFSGLQKFLRGLGAGSHQSMMFWTLKMKF